MEPKIVTLEKEPQWYFKVTGMLQQNYAFIYKETDGKAIVYFFHEQAFHLKIDDTKIENLPRVIDSLEFSNTSIANAALRFNHFSLVSEVGPDSYLDLDGYPTGKKFLDRTEPNSGIYSKDDTYWQHLSDYHWELYAARIKKTKSKI